MRDQTVGAILHAGIQHAVIAATLFKEIERAKAEETVEIFGIFSLVTGKVFAIPIGEKTVAMFHAEHDTLLLGHAQ